MNCNVNLEEHEFVNLIFDELYNYIFKMYRIVGGSKIEKGDLVSSDMIEPQEKCIKCGLVRKMEERNK